MSSGGGPHEVADLLRFIETLIPWWNLDIVDAHLDRRIFDMLHRATAIAINGAVIGKFMHAIYNRNFPKGFPIFLL